MGFPEWRDSNTGLLRVVFSPTRPLLLFVHSRHSSEHDAHCVCGEASLLLCLATLPLRATGQGSSRSQVSTGLGMGEELER